MPELPIACTLTPDAKTDRLRLIDDLRRDALIAREPTGAGARLRLRDTPDVERRARELVAAESQCCAFLTFELSRADGELVLDVSGPPDARPVVELFFAPGSIA
jgi:hypothetical protein